jgi:hypothetical protein
MDGERPAPPKRQAQDLRPGLFLDLDRGKMGTGNATVKEYKQILPLLSATTGT